MLILIRNTAFFLANCGFAIGDLRTRTARKFAELQLFCGLIVTNLRMCRIYAVIVLDLVECSNEVGLGPSRNNRKSRVYLP
jgi:hypothetical protein